MVEERAAWEKEKAEQREEIRNLRNQLIYGIEAMHQHFRQAYEQSEAGEWFRQFHEIDKAERQGSKLIDISDGRFELRQGESLYGSRCLIWDARGDGATNE